VNLFSIGLVLFSIIIFAITLGLSLNLSQKVKFHNRPTGLAKGFIEENKQNTIILKLPGDGNYTNNYNINIKISLTNNKNTGHEEKASVVNEPKKKFYRRLDEYL